MAPSPRWPATLTSTTRSPIADLILCQRTVSETVTRLVRETDPDIVGMSVMTFQRRSAERLMHLVRSLKPGVKIVVGGYDPSLDTAAYLNMPVDFVVRGEGEVTFRELTRALEGQGSMHFISGLSHKDGDKWIHNPQRAPHRLEDNEIRLPNRDARVLKGYTLLGRPVDVIETSRGCTFDCSFCSIIEMRGRNFFTYSFDRVLDDIRDAYNHGARTMFLVDDNITLNIHRFEGLCNAIIDAGLNKIDYFVQGMTSAIANHGETLAPLMRKAGFRYVFLGIENILESDLVFLQASAKNTARKQRQEDRQRYPAGHRLSPQEQHVRRRRPHRGQPRRYCRVHRDQSRIRAQVCRLAVHPAPHAVPEDAHDRRLPPPGPHRKRAPSMSTMAPRRSYTTRISPSMRSNTCDGGPSAA